MWFDRGLASDGLKVVFASHINIGLRPAAPVRLQVLRFSEPVSKESAQRLGIGMYALETGSVESGSSLLG
jgi:hypothetical protein